MSRKSKSRSVKVPGTRANRAYAITCRLDESLPLETPEWINIERLLIRLTEFAPNEILTELSEAIAYFGDDQARRAYILGQRDLAAELKKRVA